MTQQKPSIKQMTQQQPSIKQMTQQKPKYDSAKKDSATTNVLVSRGGGGGGGGVQAHVEPPRTFSNHIALLLEPHHYRDSKVFRVLSHEFGVVRLYRTFSIIVTGETRCAGCLCTSSVWFEPPRTSHDPSALRG